VLRPSTREGICWWSFSPVALALNRGLHGSSPFATCDFSDAFSAALMPHLWRHSRPGWMWPWAALVWWLATLHIAGVWKKMSIVILFNPGHSMYDFLTAQHRLSYTKLYFNGKNSAKGHKALWVFLYVSYAGK